MHIPGPPVAKRSIDSRSRCLSARKSRSSVTRRVFSVIELRRIGVPFTINDFFAIRPSNGPSKIRGGDTFPIAISIAAEQCAIICAGFILPHCRSPGLSAPSAPSLLPPWPLQIDFSRGKEVKLQCVPSSSSPFSCRLPDYASSFIVMRFDTEAGTLPRASKNSSFGSGFRGRQRNWEPNYFFLFR